MLEAVTAPPGQPAVRVAQPPAGITIADVTQRYGEPAAGTSVLALDRVSLDIAKGEFVTLLGPSGCGKSTLLGIVGGLIAPTAGQVSVNGARVRGPVPDRIAFVFQESTLFPWYTVAENFAVACRYRGIPRSEWKALTANALASVGMAAFANHYPNELSIGMRQRVNLARGIAMGTDILLMDEPFAALDEQTRMVLGEDLSLLLAKTGKTIVFVTHSLSEAVFLSDRIAVMSARPGRIKTVIEVSEPHPRPPQFLLEPRFMEIRNRCYALLRDEIRQAMMAGEGMAGP